MPAETQADRGCLVIKRQNSAIDSTAGPPGSAAGASGGGWSARGRRDRTWAGGDLPPAAAGADPEAPGRRARRPKAPGGPGGGGPALALPAEAGEQRHQVLLAGKLPLTAAAGLKAEAPGPGLPTPESGGPGVQPLQIQPPAGHLLQPPLHTGQVIGGDREPFSDVLHGEIHRLRVWREHGGDLIVPVGQIQISPVLQLQHPVSLPG